MDRLISTKAMFQYQSQEQIRLPLQMVSYQSWEGMCRKELHHFGHYLQALA